VDIDNPTELCKNKKTSRIQVSPMSMNDVIDRIAIVVEKNPRNNVLVPIGLGDKDWSCYYNYTMLPGTGDLSWSPLNEAMSYYKDLRQIYTDGKLDPKIFPLMSFERCLWAITGSEVQQSTSLIFRFYTDDVSNNNFEVDIACNNLTEMINNMSRDDFEMGMIWNYSK
jgi:hypothetical protein